MNKPSKEQALAAVRTIIEYIGDNPDREGLIQTPERVIRSWDRIYGGYRQTAAEILSKTFDSDGYDQMIVLSGIEFWSMCEHHMLPFYGKVSVGYLPSGSGGRVLGISKLARVVEVYARRLQIQERLCQEIANAISESVGARGVGVVIEAKHLCMVSRGVEKQQSTMVTSTMLGTFRESGDTRNEFMAMIGR